MFRPALCRPFPLDAGPGAVARKRGFRGRLRPAAVIAAHRSKAHAKAIAEVHGTKRRLDALVAAASYEQTT